MRSMEFGEFSDDDILNIREELAGSVVDANNKRQAIYSAVSEVLDKFDIKSFLHFQCQ